MSDASVTLGLDSASFEGGLARAGSGLTTFASKATSAFSAATEGSERLITSGHRAARQVQNLARDFTSGAGAADIMADSMTALERTMRLPLGALAGFAIGAVLFEGAVKARKEIAEFDEKLDEIRRKSNEGFSIFGDYKKDSENVQAELDKAKEAAKAGFGNVFAFLAHPIRYFSQTRSQEAAGQTGELEQDLAQAKESEFKKENLPYTLKDNVDAGLISKSIADAISKSLTIPESARDNFYKEIARGIAEKNSDKGKETLGEIAARPATFGAGTEGIQNAEQFVKEGILAREAQAEDAEAERQRLGGNQTGFEEHHNRAIEIEKGITGLRGSEKAEVEDTNAASILATIALEVSKLNGLLGQ